MESAAYCLGFDLGLYGGSRFALAGMLAERNASQAEIDAAEVGYCRGQDYGTRRVTRHD